ncbi:MAG: hypothetical protein KAG14_04305, partial [Mycoplasmataceae bacterium]|nr:hypothetical protein [Mycoplasmataceae bacterium]
AKTGLKAANWGIAYKNIASLMYISYGINITTDISDAQLNLMKADALAGKMDPKSQVEVDKWADSIFGGKSGSNTEGPWRDSAQTGPFRLLKKLSDLAKVVFTDGYKAPDLPSASWKSFITGTAISSLRNPSSLDLIDINDTISFERDAWSPNNVFHKNVFNDSKTTDEIKEFQIFA